MEDPASLLQRFRELRVEIELFRIHRTGAEIQLPILRELTEIGHKLRMLGTSTTVHVGIDQSWEAAAEACWSGAEPPRGGWLGTDRGEVETTRHQFKQRTRSSGE